MSAMSGKGLLLPNKKKKIHWHLALAVLPKRYCAALLQSNLLFLFCTGIILIGCHCLDKYLGT